jgi:hypothetical protein
MLIAHDMEMIMKLTPTAELIGDVLAARYRLGENIWTFSTQTLPACRDLKAQDLIGTKSGIVPNTYQAWLTEAGKERFLDKGYGKGLAERQGVSTSEAERDRFVRNSEKSIERALVASSQGDFETQLRLAEVYATLALAVGP